MTAKPLRLVVVGRDTALWLSAAVLSRALGPTGVTVVAVELPSTLSRSEVHATMPALEAMHAALEVDEAALLRSTGGSFSLGWNIVPPAGSLPPFFLAHGSYGVPIDGEPFFAHWLKARRFGLPAALEDFSLTAASARQGRILLPDDSTAPFGRTDYGYHLPAVAYAAFLKSLAARMGVAIHQTRGFGVQRDSETGAIEAVELDDQAPVSGDYFIDATGASGELISAVPDVAFDHSSPAPFADRVLQARGAAFSSTPVYGEVRVSDESWTSLHATAGQVGVTHAFASAAQTDDEALAGASRASGLDLQDAIARPIVRGRRSRAWSGNCIAIGAAACALDPLMDLELHVAQLGLVHLISLFADGAECEAERREYNRITSSAFERMGEFQAMFYACNRFSERGPWAEARAADQPPAVAHKMAAFRARGEVAPMEDESFTPDQWRALLSGLGEVPESWPPAIDRTPPERLKSEFRRILGFIKDKVLDQPVHDVYLRSLASRAAA
jgi:tryptophan halogenase